MSYLAKTNIYYNYNLAKIIKKSEKKFNLYKVIEDRNFDALK